MAISDECMRVGWLDYFTPDSYFAESSLETLIDPHSFIAWCTQCTISRMVLGFLTPYQAISPTELDNFSAIHWYLYRYMSQPLLINYLHSQSLIAKTLLIGKESAKLYCPAEME